MAKRTHITFQYSGDLSTMVDHWASENGFKPKHVNPSRKLFQKGIGFWVAPMMFEISKNSNGTFTLQAWVRTNLFVRLMSFFIIPAEMGIESGGFRLLLPRKIARDAINKLLIQLQQSSIP